MSESISRRTVVAGIGGMLGLAALGPLAGCAPKARGSKGFVPGTYTGSAPGMYGDIKVQVTVDEKAITSIEVLEYQDTGLIVETAIDDLPKRIIESQSLEVDATTGATMSSEGIRNAVDKALAEAGGSKKVLASSLPNAEKEELPDQEFDIVIVGAGGAGMAAAIRLGE